MWLAYLDEGGNTGMRLDDPDQPLHWLVAVLVPEDEVQGLSNAVDSLLAATFDGNIAHELHGWEIFSGSGPWKGVAPTLRVDIYEQALALLPTYQCVVAHASINKTKLTPGTSMAPHLLALQFLVEKIDRFLGTQEDPLRQRALIVADQTNEHEAFAIEMVTSMQRAGAGVVAGRRLERIVDNAHFVRSETSRGVQLADLVAYALNRDRRAGPSPESRNAKTIRRMLEQSVHPVVATWRATWPQ